MPAEMLDKQCFIPDRVPLHHFRLPCPITAIDMMAVSGYAICTTISTKQRGRVMTNNNNYITIGHRIENINNTDSVR